MSSSKSEIQERFIDGNVIEVCGVDEFQAMESDERIHVFAGEDEFYGNRLNEFYQSYMESVPENMINNNDMSMLCPTEDDISMFYMIHGFLPGTCYMPYFEHKTCYNPGNLMVEACGLHSTGDLMNCSIVGSSFELQSSQNGPYLLPWQVTGPQITVPEDTKVACEDKLYDSVMESVCVISDRSISDASVVGCSLVQPNERWVSRNCCKDLRSNFKSRHEFSNAGIRCVPDDSRTFDFDFSNTKCTLIHGDVITSGRENGNLNHVKRGGATIRRNFVRRPRDRQMIQDHLKVLRDIVPGGYKCSIDHLLHRSIRHMLFLRMANERDEKFMNYLDNEVMMKNESRGFQTYGEIGRFPIVLEDLQRRGHLFIEIFCEEDGLFLDISRVICSLGLTILKGWMEKRREHGRAGFIVEVGTKLFHKMEILYPLLQLVQKKAHSSATNMFV